MGFRKKDEIKVVDAGLPSKPDPFWPAGAAPLHLSKEMLSKDASILAPFIEKAGPLWRCSKCKTVDLTLKSSDKRYCINCLATEAQNSSLAKKTNSNWMDEAEELGLSIFERQPEETDNEWRVWVAYRSYYPNKLPTWTELANSVNMSVATVIRAAGRWSFKVRIIAWSKFTDESIQEKRIAAIKEMNEKQLGMAQTIQSKLAKAIELITPETLRPGEIVNLFKIATELERRITVYVDEKVESSVIGNKNNQVNLTKAEDINDVIAILQKTGLLEGKTIGIEHTTRLIAKED
jgi:transcription elongation factor Elf1